MTERFHPHEPILRLLLGCRGVALAGDVEPSMGTRPDAGIFVSAPVDEIVPALGARTGVV